MKMNQRSVIKSVRLNLCLQIEMKHNHFSQHVLLAHVYISRWHNPGLVQVTDEKAVHFLEHISHTHTCPAHAHKWKGFT